MSLGVGLFSFNEFLVSTALPSAVRDTGGVALMSWAVTVYLVPSIVAGSYAALLKQRLSSRTSLMLAGLVFLAGTLVAGMAPSMAVILLGRAMQGLGDGVIAALCYALLPALFPPNLIPRVFGVEALVWALSACGGPLLSGWLTQLISWRAAFLVNLPMIACFLVLVPIVAPREERARTPATAGALSGAGRLLGIAAGILLVSVSGIVHRAALCAACLLASALLLVWSVRADRSSKVRLFPADFLQPTSRVGVTYWTILLMPLAEAVASVYLVLALQHVWRFRPALAGGAGALIALSWSSFSLVVAALPRWRLWLAGLGPLLNMLGLAAILCALQTGWLPLALLGQVSIGASFGLCWARLSQLAMDAVVPKERDRAAALLPTVQSAGYAIGAAIAGLAANLAGLPTALGSGNPAAALSWAFGVSVGLSAIAVVSGSRAGLRTQQARIAAEAG